jgi:hypothetical protein
MQEDRRHGQRLRPAHDLSRLGNRHRPVSSWPFCLTTGRGSRCWNSIAPNTPLGKPS